MSILDSRTKKLLKEIQEIYPNLIIKEITETQIKIYKGEEDEFTINGETPQLANTLLHAFLTGFLFAYKQLFVNNNN